MNWNDLYCRIPDRVRIGVAGLLLALAFVSAPRAIAWWIHFWS